jgi:ATP-dependent Lhr-like helicase
VRRRGPHALLDTIEQLQGAALPASAIETLVLPSRVADYSPAMLDELTAAGDVVWAGAGSIGGIRPGGDGWVSLAPADTAPLVLPEPAEITLTPVHEAVLAALDGGGGLFFRMLADRVTRLLADDTTRGRTDAAASAGAGAGSADDLTDQSLVSAIWDLVWAGLISNDTLAPLRTMLGPAGPARRAPSPASANRWASLPVTRPGRIPSRRRLPGRPTMPSRAGPPTVSGRWSLLPERDTDPTRRAHALAETLLDRYGVLTRGTVTAERVPGGFAAVYPVLRALEDAGRCRRGYFVEGLGAAQFALPGAVDRMRALRDAAQPGGPARPTPSQALVLAAGDPANPYGAALPWPARPDEAVGAHKPGRKAGALVVLIDGELVLYVERGGRTLLSWCADPIRLGPAAAALARAVRDGALGRLTVERADGAGVYDSPLAHALQAAGFHPTPRGLRLRG